MSHYRRANVPGASYFFTVATYQRNAILMHPEVRSALRDAINYTRQSLPFTIDAWVLLPDHLHAIWTLPVGDAAFGKRWGIIKAHVSRDCAHFVDANDSERPASRVRRREIDFWQRRFWEHLLRDDSDYERHVDYVHFNPVKHGHAERPVDWPYSTFHRYVAKGVYQASWAVDPGVIDARSE